MSAKNIIGIIISIVFVGGILYFVTNTPKEADLDSNQEIQNSQSTDTASDTSTETSETKKDDTKIDTGTPAQVSTYTIVDVSAHNSSTSCWTIIDGSVYDLTKWITQHPGGEKAILSICGKDGTAVFSGKHGMNGKQATILAGFKIGTLKN